MNSQQHNLQIILNEASNENTHPKRLTEIYHTYRQVEIQKALTSNPNTPLAILIELAADYPAQFLENVALDLHLRLESQFISRNSRKNPN